MDQWPLPTYGALMARVAVHELERARMDGRLYVGSADTRLVLLVCVCVESSTNVVLDLGREGLDPRTASWMSGRASSPTFEHLDALSMVSNHWRPPRWSCRYMPGDVELSLIPVTVCNNAVYAAQATRRLGQYRPQRLNVHSPAAKDGILDRAKLLAIMDDFTDELSLIVRAKALMWERTVLVVPYTPGHLKDALRMRLQDGDANQYVPVMPVGETMPLFVVSMLHWALHPLDGRQTPVLVVPSTAKAARRFTDNMFTVQCTLMKTRVLTSVGRCVNVARKDGMRHISMAMFPVQWCHDLPSSWNAMLDMLFGSIVTRLIQLRRAHVHSLGALRRPHDPNKPTVIWTRLTGRLRVCRADTPEQVCRLAKRLLDGPTATDRDLFSPLATGHQSAHVSTSSAQLYNIGKPQKT